MLVSSGIAMEIHYCMGKRAGVEFYNNDNDKCGRCGMKEKKNGCCHDEHQFHKLNDFHKNVSNDICFEAPFDVVEISFPLYNWQVASSPVAELINNHSPPGYLPPPASILHGVFRL
jgi:hypothetical protein